MKSYSPVTKHKVYLSCTIDELTLLDEWFFLCFFKLFFELFIDVIFKRKAFLHNFIVWNCDFFTLWRLSRQISVSHHDRILERLTVVVLHFFVIVVRIRQPIHPMQSSNRGLWQFLAPNILLYCYALLWIYEDKVKGENEYRWHREEGQKRRIGIWGKAKK